MQLSMSGFASHEEEKEDSEEKEDRKGSRRKCEDGLMRY